jgi:hypothetical protein
VILSSNSTLTQAALAGAFAFSGNDPDARKILAELAALASRKYVSQAHVAAVYAGLGENEEALTHLERAYNDRCGWLLRCVMTDPRIDSLREEPRFKELARRLRPTDL